MWKVSWVFGQDSNLDLLIYVYTHVHAQAYADTHRYTQINADTRIHIYEHILLLLFLLFSGE